MNQAFEIARKHQEKADMQNKKYYDRKLRGVELVVGDRVLTRNREKGGTYRKTPIILGKYCVYRGREMSRHARVCDCTRRWWEVKTSPQK